MDNLNDHKNDESIRYETSIDEKKKNEKEKKEDIDFIFDHIVGSGKWNDFGQWTSFSAILVILFCGISPVYMHVYAAFERYYRCLVPVCDGLNESATFDSNWRAFTSPAVGSKDDGKCQTQMLRVDETYDSCRRYTLMEGRTSCEPNSFNQKAIEVCTEFVYDQSVVFESLTTKFNLVCDLEYQQMMLGSIIMCSLMFGSVIAGPMSDKMGRKNALIYSILVCVPTVMFAGYSHNFWTYAILKIANTICLPCIWFSCHILVTEILGKQFRQNAVVIKDMMCSISMMIEIFLFYLTQHWVYFHLAVGGICLLTIPALFIVPESPRWLSVNGKWKEAEKVLLKIGQWNKNNLTKDKKLKISSVLQQMDGEIDIVQEQNLSIFDMAKPNNFKRTLILTLNWIIAVVTTFTLAFNVTKLSG